MVKQALLRAPAMPGLAVLIAVLAGTAAAATPRVRHVPPAEAEAGAALELVAVAPPAAPTLVLHYRTVGAAAYTTLELVRRPDQSWVAVVPAAAVAPPGLEYFLDAGGTPVFATAQQPHRTQVAVGGVEARRLRDEKRTAGRSRFHLSYEYVSYGKRPVEGEARTLADSYYRIDADFAYRLRAYPLEEMRVGYTRLLGDTPSDECTTTPPCNERAGFKVAGWFELGLAPIEGVGLDARGMVLATQDGFAVGGRAELRLGVRDATHVASGVEFMEAVGTTGYFRFGWGTVPKLPMAATVEITQLPSSDARAGIRLLYDIFFTADPGIRVGVRAGYTARDQDIAGFTGGASASIDF